MAVPIGREPVGKLMVSSFTNPAVSTTCTVPAVSDGMNARLPSGRKATVLGRPPTWISATVLFVVVSMTTTSPPVSQVTWTNRPSGESATPSGSFFTRKIRSTSPSAMLTTLDADEIGGDVARDGTAHPRRAGEREQEGDPDGVFPHGCSGQMVGRPHRRAILVENRDRPQEHPGIPGRWRVNRMPSGSNGAIVQA